MQKKAAYILLAAFIVMQFAKQVSYAECRLTNYFSGSGKQCDCEKILAEKTGLDQSTQQPAGHQHLHIDDMYSFASLVTEKEWRITMAANYITTDVNRWKNAVTGSIDRPPSGTVFPSIFI
ncbi:MAG: hypothetical protein J0L56_18465 [Chitinophagales bacterium]|nr:hypothetical protein [Chitinophagales bacterium]